MREITIKKTIPSLNKRTAKRWARFTEESNRRFQAMTPAQKRVAIAEDVIAQLEAGALVARNGHYVSPRNHVPAETNEALTGVDLSIALPYFEACDVCAVGSIMVCTIMRDDHVVYTGDTDEIDDDVHEKAGRFFSAKQLDAMEGIFENWRFQEWSIEDWFPGGLGAGEILTLLMQHVIDSGGSFSVGTFGAWLKKGYAPVAPRRKHTSIQPQV